MDDMTKANDIARRLTGQHEAYGKQHHETIKTKSVSGDQVSVAHIQQALAALAIALFLVVLIFAVQAAPLMVKP